jgi:hypothetical protein
VAGSKVRGIASSPGDYAWNVNFNNGNANWNNQSNNGFVRAVRVGECQDAVSFRDLYTAWRDARRAKKASRNQLSFDARWLDGLLALQHRINAGTWEPSPPTCFIAKQPKAREIHAPDFGDRVVHHWLVPKLEAIYESTFIHDSYSNRVGKGTHAAVERLRGFVRQVHAGQGGGWYLQLDISNFFNSIHRPTLYAMLKRRMEERGLPLHIRRITHALLRYPADHYGVHYRSTVGERSHVPPHKQLANASPGCGIAIGNLSSQFFANVYLDALDQFVKHTLKAKRYLRFVDDFVLVHESRAQLQAWQDQIAEFLRDRLALSVKPDIKLRPLGSGIDFLGYVVYPTHSVVRRRVIAHACSKLRSWERRHVHARGFQATPEQYRELQSIWSSYGGHFRHASSHRLQQRFHERFPWLRSALVSRTFDYRLDGQTVSIRSSAPSFAIAEAP